MSHTSHLVCVLHLHVFSFHLFSGNPGNFEPLRDEDSEGPGQRGEAHNTKPEMAERVEEAIDSYGMNMVASNEISMDRSLPDTRMPECKDWHYPAELPKVELDNSKLGSTQQQKIC